MTRWLVLHLAFVGLACMSISSVWRRSEVAYWRIRIVFDRGATSVSLYVHANAQIKSLFTSRTNVQTNVDWVPTANFDEYWWQISATLPWWGFIVGNTAIYVMNRLPRRSDPLQCCRRCGYSLVGNCSGRCPECGAVILAAIDDVDQE